MPSTNRVQGTVISVHGWSFLLVLEREVCAVVGVNTGGCRSLFQPSSGRRRGLILFIYIQDNLQSSISQILFWKHHAEVIEALRSWYVVVNTHLPQAKLLINMFHDFFSAFSPPRLFASYIMHFPTPILNLITHTSGVLLPEGLLVSQLLPLFFFLVPFPRAFGTSLPNQWTNWLHNEWTLPLARFCAHYWYTWCPPMHGSPLLV